MSRQRRELRGSDADTLIDEAVGSLLPTRRSPSQQAEHSELQQQPVSPSGTAGQPDSARRRWREPQGAGHHHTEARLADTGADAAEADHDRSSERSTWRSSQPSKPAGSARVRAAAASGGASDDLGYGDFRTRGSMEDREHVHFFALDDADGADGGDGSCSLLVGGSGDGDGYDDGTPQPEEIQSPTQGPVSAAALKAASKPPGAAPAGEQPHLSSRAHHRASALVRADISLSQCLHEMKKPVSIRRYDEVGSGEGRGGGGKGGWEEFGGPCAHLVLDPCLAQHVIFYRRPDEPTLSTLRLGDYQHHLFFTRPDGKTEVVSIEAISDVRLHPFSDEGEVGVWSAEAPLALQSGKQKNKPPPPPPPNTRFILFSRWLWMIPTASSALPTTPASATLSTYPCSASSARTP